MLSFDEQFTLIAVICKSHALSYSECEDVIYNFYNNSPFIPLSYRSVIEKVYDISYKEMAAKETLEKTERLIAALKDKGL